MHDHLSYWARRRGEFNDEIFGADETPAERITGAVCIVVMLGAAVALAIVMGGNPL